MKGIKNLIFFLLCIFSTVANAQYITVDDNQSAQQLVEDVLVRSSCASITSSTATGDNFTTGHKSYGYFNAGTSNFPFREGVVLATSTSRAAEGPYTASSGGGSASWRGDSDLNQIFGINSVNATALEFDFIALTNLVSFNYIFASNEYRLDYPCGFSDAFAFLIKESGTTEPYKNIAVLPDNTTPVSSMNIHPNIIDVPGNIYPGCPPKNETYFNGYNTTSSPINYSGQTVKLNAHTDVIIGRTYHVKLVIADDISPLFDSAVFLEAGSFSAKVDLGADRTFANNKPVCYGDSFTIDTKLPSTYSYEWYRNGDLIPNEINPTLTVTTPGDYKVKVTFSPNCSTEDDIKIEYTPQIVLNNTTTLYQCDDNGDGISVFDLSKAVNIIKNNDPALNNLSYYKSLSDAQNQINTIQNITSYTNSVPNETLIARVSNAYGCYNFAPLKLAISNNSISQQNPIQSCDNDATQDGITQFDLNTQVTPQVIYGLPLGLTVEYYLNTTDAITQKNKLPNLFTNTIPNQQTIYARIVNGPDCYEITPETLVVNVFNPTDFQDENSFICDNSSATLTVQSGFSSYLWSNGSTTNTTTITSPGEYTVMVTNSIGCQKTKKYIVKPSGVGTITNVAVSDFSGNQNSISISYTGSGDYEFSLDEISYQDSPVFNSLSPGMYWATTKDKNGCGISTPYQIYVLDYPRFFTPNNDNHNDTWKINNLDLLPKSSITIFDRYGKLLKQLNDPNIGWNGTYLGRDLSADDYWFVITFEDGKIIRGHFSLIR